MIAAWLTRMTAPFVWRTPSRAARLLASFQRAEASSMLDLLDAARQTSSPERRALYLRHALDEERHARTFAARARQLGLDDRREADLPSSTPSGRGVSTGVDLPSSTPSGRGVSTGVDFDALYDRLGELGFLAYVNRGERRGRAQFEEHRRVLEGRGETRDAAIFEAILVDEERHERYTGELLVELGGERGARRALRIAALREALWRWRRLGRGMAGVVFSIAASLLFVVLLPFALYDRFARRPTKGWR